MAPALQVGDEHLPRGVRDAQRQAAALRDPLRRDAAAPEHRHLVIEDLDRVAVVGPREVGDPQRVRIAHVHRRAVRLREAAADLDHLGDVAAPDRAHAHHHLAAEPARRRAGDVGAVHRHVALLHDVAQRDAGLLQRRFEREAAADQETHEVGLPQRGDLRALLDELAVAVDAVAGDVGSDVRPGRAQHLPRAGRHHLDQRARLGVALAEQQEVEGVGLRDDHQVGLDAAGRVSGGGQGECAGSTGVAQRAGVVMDDVHGVSLG
jgi:hypothetical protein